MRIFPSPKNSIKWGPGVSAITWHDIQQLSINLPEFTQFVQLMNWQNNKIAQSISKRITCISPCDLYKMTSVLAWCITPWMVGILIHLWNGWREVGRWSPFIRPIVLWGHRGRARPRRRWGNSWACWGTVGPNVKNPPKIRLKNSWNWRIVLVPATIWQTLKVKRAQRLKTEVMQIFQNLLNIPSGS